MLRYQFTILEREAQYDTYIGRGTESESHCGALLVECDCTYSSCSAKEKPITLQLTRDRIRRCPKCLHSFLTTELHLRFPFSKCETACLDEECNLRCIWEFASSRSSQSMTLSVGTSPHRLRNGIQIEVCLSRWISTSLPSICNPTRKSFLVEVSMSISDMSFETSRQQVV
jgi:hypothetical protein